MEAYDTTKNWSTVIAKQIDIQSAVIKATQLGFTSIIIVTHSEGREQRWKQNKEFHWYSRAPFADIQHLSQHGIKLIVQAVPGHISQGTTSRSRRASSPPYILFGWTKSIVIAVLAKDFLCLYIPDLVLKKKKKLKGIQYERAPRWDQTTLLAKKYSLKHHSEYTLHKQSPG